MDDADRAAELDTITQKHIDAISRQSTRRELNPKGRCHWCDEPVEGKRLFCDSDCANDYERSRKNK